MKLSSDFYKNLSKITSEELEEQKSIAIFNQINWESEADRCLSELIEFFERLDMDQFQENEVGVVDIRWNEYGGDVEIDFMPENNLEIAFNAGCIMNNSAIDNDLFFIEYFDCEGEKSFEIIDRDYTALIRVFFNILSEIAHSLVESSSFQKLPKREPYYITFAFFHDDEPDIIYDSKNQ